MQVAATGFFEGNAHDRFAGYLGRPLVAAALGVETARGRSAGGYNSSKNYQEPRENYFTQISAYFASTGAVIEGTD